MRGHLLGPRSCCDLWWGDDCTRGRLQAHALSLPPRGVDSDSPAHGYGNGAWPGSKGQGLCLDSTLMLGPQVSCLSSLSLTFLLCKMGPTEDSPSSGMGSEKVHALHPRVQRSSKWTRSEVWRPPWKGGEGNREGQHGARGEPSQVRLEYGRTPG